ncbi:hypothetical protein KUTeg_001466 [Tegillarca granosa]|uniref:Uncharacterized protein n=1 Tax=Tegillarca granosa TaxID=220873 RepID=A0ABQ9FRI7_TEGGR|nr:hypothetical protein KUTeg_001466 [Tegillarca granosa]
MAEVDITYNMLVTNFLLGKEEMNSQCPALITTLNNIPVNFARYHNHDPDAVQLAADAFINNSISVQKSIKKIPKLPTTQQEIELDGAWKRH